MDKISKLVITILIIAIILILSFIIYITINQEHISFTLNGNNEINEINIDSSYIKLQNSINLEVTKKIVGNAYAVKGIKLYQHH